MLKEEEIYFNQVDDLFKNYLRILEDNDKDLLFVQVKLMQWIEKIYDVIDEEYLWMSMVGDEFFRYVDEEEMIVFDKYELKQVLFDVFNLFLDIDFK